MAIATPERNRLIDDLIEQLKQNAEPKTKQWFDNYLKGAITYRGLKTPLVNKLVKDWHDRHQLELYSPIERWQLCKHLIAHNFAEDKFAGTIYLQKFLLAKFDYQLLLTECSKLFESGYFFDWSTTDWFCTRILDPTITEHGLDVANTIANWRFAGDLWQRRAAIVSFRHATSDSKYHDLIELIIADLVNFETRFLNGANASVLLCSLKEASLYRYHY